MNFTIFDNFKKILYRNEGERNKGAADLLLHMSDLKQQNEEQKKQADYILKRVIRGLGSMHHKNKEVNYSLLYSHLNLNANISAEKILEIMDHELDRKGNNAKSETADIYFGRILTYGALIRAKVLQKCKPETEQKVLEGLLHASKQRSYLTHCAITFLIDYVSQVDEEHFKNHLWPILEKEVYKPWSEQTLDSIHLLLTLRQQFFQVVTGKELKKRFGSKEIVAEENVDAICRILVNIPRIICCNHPVYEIIVQKAYEKGIAINIWTKLDELFQKPSDTVKHVAVKLVSHLSKLDVNLIPGMLTPNFLQYIMKSCQQCKNSKKDEATTLLKECLSKMMNAVNDSELDLKIVTIKKLLLCPGDLMLEKKTNIKIFHIFFTNLSSENVKELVDILKNIIAGESQKEVFNSDPVNWTNQERVYATQVLTRFLGHPKMIAEHDWRLEQLVFLIENGLCEQNKVGKELADSIKDSFYRAIDHKLSSLNDLKCLLTNLITTLNTKLFVEKTWTLRTPFDENTSASWKKMFKLIKKLDKSVHNKSIVITFGTMNLHMGLQLFQDSEMAVSSIEDLHICYNKISPTQILSNNSINNEEKEMEEKQNEPQWFEVVVDLLLSLLSKTNHLLRSVVNCVFPHICPHLTTSAVHHILSVLDVEKNALKPIKDEQDSESSESDSESEDESVDESKQNGNAINNEDDESSDDEEDEDDDIEESDGEEDNENQIMMNNLKMNLWQALGGNGSDAEDMDVDEISEEEGKRLDLSLAAAFNVIRENKKNPKKQGKDEETLMHFRTRVIDLLEIYLEHSPEMACVLDMIGPLFTLLQHCIKDRHQKPLENRIRSCLTKLSLVKKFSNIEGVDEQIILDTLKFLMEKGERSAAISLEMGDKFTQCCIFLIRCLQQTKCPADSISDFINEKLAECFKKSILPLTLFKSILKLAWEENFKFLPAIISSAFGDKVRPFLRHYALDFLVCFYHNDRLFTMASKSSKKIIKKMEKELYDQTMRVLKECSEPTEGKEVKQKFLADLFGTLKIVHVKHTESSWDSNDFVEAMERVGENITSKLTKVAYRKLMAVIKPQENKGTKRQNEEKLENGKKKKIVNESTI